MTVWNSLDLQRHAVIEASAGTGKTYALERIVVRLLEDCPDLTMDQLLLVTFTEKAAGELKGRVRAILEHHVLAGCEDTPASVERLARLRAALDMFDGAAIFTIHGFCQRVLTEYAFENRQVMDLDVVRGMDVIRRTLHRLVRLNPARYIGDPRLSMEMSASVSSPAQWLDQMAALLEAYRGSPWDRLAEASHDDSAGDDIEMTLAQRLAEAHQTLRRQAPAPLVAGCLTTPFLRLNARKPTLKARLRLVEAVETWLLADPARSGGADGVSAFVALADRLRAEPYAAGEGFGALVALPWLKTGSNLDEVFPELPSLADALDALLMPLIRQWLPSYRHRFSIRLLNDARFRIERLKADHGWVTFDDMIRQVWQALCGHPRTNPLIDALRRRYRVALVDEFQDTDPLQWDIFRRLFVEDAPDHRLIVVGDPKQAIYGFRGANVNTYLAARNVLLEEAGAVRYALRETYRCVPDLVRVFNAMFKGRHWFAPAEEGTGNAITYADVQCPADNPRIRIHQDRTGRGALTLVDLDEGSHEPSLPAMRRRMARFVADEIARLTRDPGMLVFQDPGAPPGSVRRLKEGDIGILVETRRGATLLEAYLRDRKIPYTIYKQPGLYQSEEARHVSVMLDFLAYPEDAGAFRAALLTRFFGADPATIGAEADEPTHRRRLALCDRLLDLCARRQWGRLFDALMVDTGLWWREGARADGDRRLSAYRQLFDDLLEAAGRDVADVAGMAARFRERMAESLSEATEQNLHQKESEGSKVQIMTMHVAKGLEFPVLFIADGFSDPADRMRAQPFLRLPNPPEGASRDLSRLYALDRQAHRLSALEAAAEEQQRLYYVALTRAQYKLYLPWCSGMPETNRRKGCALFRLMLPGIERLRHHAPDLLESPPGGFPGNAPVRSDASSLARPEAPVASAVEVRLFECPSVASRIRHVHSFTSLARHDVPGRDDSMAPSVADVTDDPPDLAGDEAATAIPGQEEPPGGGSPSGISLLPGGVQAGEAFHRVMETLCHPGPGRPGFETVRAAAHLDALFEHSAFMDAMDAALAEFRIPNRQCVDPVSHRLQWETRRELALLVWRALRAPLPPDGVRLQDLRPEDRKAEVEFHLAASAVLPGSARAPSSGSLLTGFMDLVFRHAGRYYVLDWKTNRIPDGSADAVSALMEQNDYHLQYRIYTLAVREWLRQSLPPESPDARFGGVYYLFVRAGGAAADAPPGIFFEAWDASRLTGCLHTVRARMDEHHPGDPFLKEDRP